MVKNSVILGVIVSLIIIVGLVGYIYLMDPFGEEDEGTTPPPPEVNEPPIAKFTAEPQLVHVDEIVKFDGNSSEDPDGEIEYYKWDFGDGHTAEGINASWAEHSYSYGGEYVVNFTVQDNLAARNSAYKTITVIPRNYEASGAMLLLAREDSFKNDSASFPVEEEAIRCNISVTLRGMSFENGLENAEFEIYVYNPYYNLLDSEEVTVSGTEQVEFGFDENELTTAGDYTLEVACISGGGYINYEIEVIYQFS